MSERAILTPGEVGEYLNGLMGRDRLLSNLLVRGEISGHSVTSRGHHFFTLKDRDGALQCVMYAGRAQFLRFRPKDGMQVIVSGKMSLYTVSGKCQLICSQITPDGMGGLAAAFELLKEKLAREGLFDPAHRKPVPVFPRRIALITSPRGDAVHDMIRILGARWPMAEVCVIPVQVQGVDAPAEIAAAIRWADQNRVADVLITGRGGGKVEELWAFNEEIVVRAIYNTRTPIITAVGHEPDVTIADFAADLRAATPSNAAELAVPDRNKMREGLQKDGKRLEGAVSGLLARRRQAVDRLAASRSMKDPASYFREKRLRLDVQSRRMLHGLERTVARKRDCLRRVSAGLPGGMERTVSRKREQLGAGAAALDALSPLKVLGRGYSIARREDGRSIVSTKDVAAGDQLKLTLTDGSLDCRVESVHNV